MFLITPQKIPPPLLSGIHPKKNGVPSSTLLILERGNSHSVQNLGCRVDVPSLQSRTRRLLYEFGELFELCNCREANRSCKAFFTVWQFSTFCFFSCIQSVRFLPYPRTPSPSAFLINSAFSPFLTVEIPCGPNTCILVV
jgi:hypothetical protein